MVWTKVGQIDEKIKDGIDKKFSDFEKNQTGRIEAVTRQNAADREAWSVIEQIREAFCKRDYAQVERLYLDFSRNVNIEALPGTASATLYDYYITVLVQQSKFDAVPAADVVRMANQINKYAGEATCTERDDHVAALMLATGNYDQASKKYRKALQEAVGRTVPEYWAHYVAPLLIAELLRGTGSATDRAAAAFQLLLELEGDYTVPFAVINDELKLYSESKLLGFLRMTRPGELPMAYKLLTKTITDNNKMVYEDTLNGQPVIRVNIQTPTVHIVRDEPRIVSIPTTMPEAHPPIPYRPTATLSPSLANPHQNPDKDDKEKRQPKDPMSRPPSGGC